MYVGGSDVMCAVGGAAPEEAAAAAAAVAAASAAVAAQRTRNAGRTQRSACATAYIVPDARPL